MVDPGVPQRHPNPWRALRIAPLLAAALCPSGALGDCKTVDLRPQLGPPRIQDGTSWCYAHSSADLLSQAVGKRISSVDLAVTYLMGDESKLRKIPHPRMRAYLAEHPGFFRRLEESRHEEDAYKPDRILSSDGIMNTGGRDDEAIVLSNLKGLCLSANLPAGPENIDKYLKAIREDLRKDGRKETDPKPIGAVGNEVARIMAHAFQKWVDQACGRRVHPKAPLLPHEVSAAYSLDELKKQIGAGVLDPARASARLVTELDRVLDSGKAAAIAYESFDLYPKADGKTGSPLSDHSSVVAARKEIGGACHYFVRNHFGATCGYRPELEPGCEKEAGGVWVPAAALKHLYSVISLR